jgi:signal transduction histidine kinase
LTALLGYLDILEDPALPPEVQRAYLDICRNNALRLKDLTDELFGFFLVFGKQMPEQNLEQFDAAMLLEQILLESKEELSQQGFDIQLSWPEELQGSLRVDLGHLRRVFDNLFSNLRKYADPAEHISILVQTEGHFLRLSVANRILTSTTRVESNKIGLKTCEKLLDAMGGSFSQSKTTDTFIAEMRLPLLP